MVFLNKNRPTFVAGVLLWVSFLTTSGSCAKCCLSEMMNMDNMISIWTTGGYKNVKAISNTCDEFSMSGDIAGYTSTQTWIAKDNNAVEYITTMTSAGSVIPVSDVTKPDFCTISSTKEFLSIPAARASLSFTNPFHGQVNFVFRNSSHNACIRIYTLRGVMVVEQKNVREAQWLWIPSSLNQGTYLVEVTTVEKTEKQQVIYLK